MTEESLFLAALEKQTPAERQAFLDEACGADATLRARVQMLLEADARARGILDRQIAGAPEQTKGHVPNEQPGAVIAGRYKLLEEIGEGGMGTVWVAEQTEPVRRKVALKLIKAGMDSKSVLARFEAERQALAVMDHPNIAKVLDGGLTETGRPYFVMEYVKGVPITEYCDTTRLSVPERLNLFVQVCQAVQHAHQKGIIHRDLKPSNILVAPYDDKPVPKVIDFGLAKAMHQALTERTLHTAHETVLGTPLYMSPEQAQLNNLDVDTRSDLYSLGVLLYELLTGTTPLEKQRFKVAAWDEVRRIIREEEPPRPSIRLSSAATLPSLAAGRHTEPARLTKLVRGELDWIVMKALEKDRTRRYETANVFAADVQRYLDGEPVMAAPPSARYLLGKFVRRHKGQVVAAGLVLLALLIGMAGTTWGLIEAKKQEGIAIAAQGEEARARQREANRADAEVKQRQRADEEKQRAIQFRDQALDALRATTGADVEKLIGSRTELSANEREYLEAIAQRWQGFAKQSGPDVETREYQVEGHFRVAYLWRKLGRREEAQAEFQAAFDLQKNLAAQFPAKPVYQKDLAATRNNLGNLLKDRGKNQDARMEYLAACDLLTKLVGQFPAEPSYQLDLAVTRNHLGILLMDLGQREEAILEYESARDLQKKLVKQFPVVTTYQAGLARTHNNLGAVLDHLGKLKEARAEYESARDLHKKLVKQFPTLPEHQQNLATTCNNLGILLASLRMNEEAWAEYQLSLDLLTKLVEQFPAVTDYQEALALTHFNVGNLFRDLGQKERARAEFQAARDLRKKLVALLPTVPDYQRNLAETHNNLANLLKDLGKGDEAHTEYLAARDLRTKLCQQFPAIAEYQQALASTYSSLGILLADLDKREEAREEYQLARDLLKKLVEQFPAKSEFQQDLANNCNNLGNLLTNLKKREEARAEYRMALELQKKLVERFPANVEYQVELGGSYCDFGILLLRDGKPSESLEWFDRAVQVLRPVHEKQPIDAHAKEFLRNSYWSRAQAYDLLQQKVEAIKDWDRTIALSAPGQQIALRAPLAILRLQAGMVAEAVADADELTKSDNWTAGKWYDFACVYSVASGKMADNKPEHADRAMELLRKAVKAGWKDAAHFKKDGDLDPLRDRDDFKNLQTELETRSIVGTEAKQHESP